MKQTAVYWPLSGTGVDEFGKPAYAEPVEITCRWDWVREEFVGPDGDTEISKAKLIVDRDLVQKGIMFLGGLSDLDDSDDPLNNSEAWEIRSFKKTADFKGKKYLREVYL
jgi:hypothetical protein